MSLQCGNKGADQKNSYFRSMNTGLARLIFLGMMVGLLGRAVAQDSLQLRFMAAVEQDDLQRVKELLKQGADVNMSVVASRPNYLFFISRKLYLDGLAKSRPGESVYVSPIHANADRADIKILTVLRKKKANIEAGDSDGKTPLMYALRNPGGEEYALYLLKKGANYRSVDLAGNTVMHYAAYGGNIQGLRMTAGGGVDINVRNHEGITPLLAAAVFSSIAVLEEIVGLGGDIEATDSVGMNALHYAAAYGDRERLDWILQQLPAANVVAQNGYTPLDIARYAKNAGAVEFLRSKGGRYVAYRYDEMLDAMRRRDPDALRATLDDGADPNRKVKEWPLIIAIIQNDIVALNLLLEAGAKVDVVSTKGQQPLELAIADGNPAMCLSLVEAGATVTPAMMGECMDKIAKAEQMGYWIDLAKAIMGKLQDINIACGKLNIPVLHYAAYLGQEDLVDAVLQAGADVNARDAQGWTALHWTAMKRDLLRLHLEKLRIAQALLTAGADVNAKSSAPKTLPHTDAYLARRVPAHATSLDILLYALPKDSDIAELLTAKGGISGLKAADYQENGIALFEQKAFQSAQLDFNRAIVADPKMAASYYYRARCLSISSAYTEVVRDLDFAINLQPLYPEALMARCKARIELGKYKEAEADANMAMRQGFAAGEALYWRGKCRMRLDDREGACKDFHESGVAGYADGAQAVKLYCK